MCGITGFFTKYKIDSESICKKMIQKVKHRGPDNIAVWVDNDHGIALGHSRLSILELSDAGHQPMVSKCNRYIIIFNGEIYNHVELRKDLKIQGYSFGWKGSSDTETLIAAISMWGVKKTLQKCIGMFAFGLWDRKNKNLTLARDRMGEKPIYYGWQGRSFLFGSELKSIKAHPEFKNAINRDSLCLLLRHNTISSPHSIYKDIFKLPPGSILTLKTSDNKIKIENFWSLKTAVQFSLDNPFEGSEEQAILELESILSKAVSGQMASDVPLGAFLSGGIDSSTVVAIMQAQSSKKIKTFSIGFAEHEYNEAKYAKDVAMVLGTDHTELYVNSSEALEVIPKIPFIFDEPFSDSSQIPTYLVSKLAKKEVDVALTGDGGDELFGGYNRHIWLKAIWNKTRHLPFFSKRLIFYAITSLSPVTWNNFFKMCSFIFSTKYHFSQIGDKMHKIAKVITATSPNEMYQNLTSHWDNPESIVLGSSEPRSILSDSSALPNLFDFEQRIMFLDALTYMSDDILTKVDRASMANSLETRVPILDHRVVEFAWKLPLLMKIKNGHGKWILRQILSKHVPKEIFERPKMGFSIPLNAWLRGPLLDWGASLLDPSKLRAGGYFNVEIVQRKWDEHISGKRDWQHHLWDVLMFQAWLENTNENF